MPDLAELNLVVNSKGVEQGTRALNDLNKAGAGTEAMSKRVAGATGGMEMGFGRILGLIGKIVAGYAAWRAAAALVEATGQQQLNEKAFTTLLGSVDKARARITELQQFAATTPFEFKGLADADRRLLAFGFDA